jgi:AbiV family abortive infection protein
MKRPVPPVPPPGDLVKLASKCFSNARQKLCAAQSELGAGRASTAHAFASLSLEETGKAVLCGLCLTVPMNAKDFWGEWKHHESKLAMAVFFCM